MKTYSNQKKLAARLKVSAPRLSELMAESDWSFGKAPWSESQAAKIDAHMKARRAVNNATAAVVEETADDAAIAAMSKNPERVARIKLIIARTAKITLDREVLAGGYIRREDVERENVARVYSVRAKLQELPLRASLLAHKSEAEIERQLTEIAREICDHYAGGGN